MASTGENEQALRKVIDFTRLASIVVLVLHFYFLCHRALEILGYTIRLVDKILYSIARTGMFESVYTTKGIVFGLLVISLVGAKGKRDEKFNILNCVLVALFGCILFFLSHFIFKFSILLHQAAITYFTITSTGYLLILTGGTWISRIINLRLKKDIFNKLNETFPQEERLLENEYSVNLPAKFAFKERERKSWINIINPFRSLLVHLEQENLISSFAMSSHSIFAKASACSFTISNMMIFRGSRTTPC